MSLPDRAAGSGWESRSREVHGGDTVGVHGTDSFVDVVATVADLALNLAGSEPYSSGGLPAAAVRPTLVASCPSDCPSDFGTGRRLPVDVVFALR